MFFFDIFDIFEDHDKIGYIDQKHNEHIYLTSKSSERYLELITSTLYDSNQYISIYINFHYFDVFFDIF